MAKYKAYPEYKDSGVESLCTIPKMWSIKKLKYIFEIKKRIAGKIGFDVLSVTQKGIKIKDIESGEGQLSMDYSKYQRVYPGEFAMNHMDLLTGYVDISNYDGVTSPDYRVFAVRDKHSFYSRYYLYLLQDGYKQRRFFHLGQGSAHLGRWRLPTEAFNEIVYPCPSLAEQIHIASFLDHETAKIDKLFEKQQQLIELLKEKRQAVISHAVTKGLNPDVPMKDSGVEWLGEVPEHWEVKKLKHVAHIIDCKNRTPEYFDDGEYLVVRTTNVKKQSLVLDDALYTNERDFKIWTERGVPPVGSILFTREAPAGEICIVPAFTKLCMGQRMMNFICHQSNYTNFLFDYLTSDCLKRYIESEAAGSTVSHLRVEQVYNIPIVIPPNSEQKNIDEMVGVMKAQYSRLIDDAECSLVLLQERRNALISAAVTGKIDVRDWVAPDTQDIEASQEATA
ncbi:restriction endonuclease subunit S [Klebsiella pneumoniae]|uniref:restriction endonuclease subunit S n=1 Tax=Klebsiella pneumoniae TaxID=573 RepID=UPI000E2BD411|nr:restriction endonuclease subunit S [Klebsiella pneumoniae]MBL4314777.1 restriction endonuclease subunit S [Klebsiella pneumoniae]MBW2955635.1 restriction endonuclease subunit S [Klebsiella pneumoniae]MCS6325050.1 restriction endonuclease subunit S [Klebsiella pneumoniae]MCS6349319.1 restriction endonuclease subunit S [Klebsiella pneumoniae]QHU68698.1 restriction endonuclease subunit S [Klebsiella pneumoniae]